MTRDERMKALFSAGDPAARLNPHLPTRVAARLSERAPRQLGWVRAFSVAVLLASSVGLGAAGVWVTKEVVRPAPAPVPAPAVAAAKAPALEDPLVVEASLLRASLEALQRGDVTAALQKLDERQQRFPSGALQSEADETRARCERFRSQVNPTVETGRRE